jgi:phosphopantothenoylcysteine decarboxylase/phosphopantothenate--cysteine ligase
MSEPLQPSFQRKPAMQGDLHVTPVSETLLGRHIVVGVAGGIAAIESPKVIRALRRLGARVSVCATENALSFVGLAALEWASAGPVTVNPSGLAEHIVEADAVLVTPATADLIAKAANGLCSDVLSTLLQSAFGKRCPVVFAPSMHLSLAESPFVQRHFTELSSLPDVLFLNPAVAEGKWKAREPDVIADEVSQFIWKRSVWGGHRPAALVTLGGTRVPIDSVRSLTNLSTGTFGTLIVRELYRHGFAVTACVCSATVRPPPFDNLVVQNTVHYEQLKAVLENIDPTSFAGLFMTAAVSDFVPSNSAESARKISSTNAELTISLNRSSKLITLPNILQIPWRFVCKLTSDRGPNQTERFQDLLRTTGAHAAFWNTTDEAFTSNQPGSATAEGAPIVGQFIATEQDGQLLTPCSSRAQAAQLAVQSFLQTTLQAG